MLRDLQSNLVGKLVCIPGIITSTSKTAIRIRKSVHKCRNCGHLKEQEVSFGLSRPVAPWICDNAKNPGADK